MAKWFCMHCKQEQRQPWPTSWAMLVHIFMAHASIEYPAVEAVDYSTN
jgi:hypothetical protein